MKKASIALLAQTIVTFDAGTHKTVQDGGDLYILIQSGEAGSAPDQPAPAPQKTAVADVQTEQPKQQATAPEPKQTAPAQTSSSNTKYTEDELMKERDINKLMDILDEMGIDPNAYEGKNTNKKLRLLILDAQEGKIVNDEAPAQQEAPQQTAPATAPRGRGRGASAPAGPRELNVDEIDALDDGDMAIVKLDFGDEENPDADKLWEVEVIGWRVPDGDTVERLHVKFLEDGAEDFIRDGDTVYEYRASI